MSPFAQSYVEQFVHTVLHDEVIPDLLMEVMQSEQDQQSVGVNFPIIRQ